MTFDADIRSWVTIESFTEYLRRIPRPGWVQGITNHNTYRPNEKQWKGVASVESCMKTYEGKGWSAGPHLFLAAEAPNASNRGIFQLTPLSHVGVHAGDCNAHHLGIENVGDFEARAPSEAQWQLMLDVNVAIARAWRLPASAVLVHKECMANRTCPGQHFDATRMRADIHARLMDALPPISTHKRYTVKRLATAGATIRAAPTRKGAPLGHLRPGDAWEGEIVKGEFVAIEGFGATDQWVEGIGRRAVWLGLLQESRS